MTTAKLTGEEIEDIKQLAADHFWPHSRPAGDMSEETGVRVVTNAEGVWITDADGKRYLDMMSCLWLVNIGHGRREIADAVHQQMTSISISPIGTVPPATARLSGRVAALAPDTNSRVYFVSGGSEANETALKMAKKYHKNNGEPTRWKVVSRMRSYHGATHAVMSLGGGGGSLTADYGPPMPGNLYVAPPDEYRCLFCSDRGGCNLECARDVDRTIEFQGPSTVAAFIGEPISAAAGIHIPHPEYWPMIREICDKHGVIMICDEVITGFGRTGKMFATEHWGITPDIFTVAKALTSGYLPIGAAIATEKVSNAFIGSEEKAFTHLITFGGNPASAAAALANLDIMIGERMVENSAEMGDYLFEKLQTMYDHPIVGHVRGGKGLLCAVELVKDRETKEKFPKEAQLSKKISPLMAKHGLMVRASDVIPLAPPLCITRDEIDYLVTSLNAVLTDLAEVL